MAGIEPPYDCPPTGLMIQRNKRGESESVIKWKAKVMKDSSWTSLTSPEAILKGFIAGCLLAGGIFNPSLGSVVDLVLVVLGIAAFIDAVMPSNKDMHGFTVFVFALAGGLVMFALSISGNSYGFIIVAVILAVLFVLKNILTGLRVLNK